MKKVPQISFKVGFENDVERKDLYKVRSSRDAYDAIMSIYDNNMMMWRESMYIMVLNTRNEVIGYFNISHGTTKGTIIDSKIIFRIAIEKMADGFILVHNHPSGSVKPSKDDIIQAKKVKEMSDIFDNDITFIDNLIVSPDNYYSFIDEGIIKQSENKVKTIVKS